MFNALEYTTLCSVTAATSKLQKYGMTQTLQAQLLKRMLNL